nr:MAG TPA: hypothetical protein [Caudoviricetes sp.]
MVEGQYSEKKHHLNRFLFVFVLIHLFKIKERHPIE